MDQQVEQTSVCAFFRNRYNRLQSQDNPVLCGIVWANMYVIPQVCHSREGGNPSSRGSNYERKTILRLPIGQ
jgi:hypothetical protein